MALRYQLQSTRFRRWCCATLLVAMPATNAVLPTARLAAAGLNAVRVKNPLYVRTPETKPEPAAKVEAPAVSESAPQHKPQPREENRAIESVLITKSTITRLPAIAERPLIQRLPFAPSSNHSNEMQSAVPVPASTTATTMERLPPPTHVVSVLVRDGMVGQPDAELTDSAVNAPISDQGMPPLDPPATSAGTQQHAENFVLPDEPPFRGTSADDVLNLLPKEFSHDWDDRQSPLSAAADRASQILRRASSRASRGAIYSARQELEATVQILTQALDSHYDTTGFTDCLREGFLALEEAADFVPEHPSARTTVDVSLAVARHRSKVLTKDEALSLTAAEAATRYLAYAEEHLVASVADSPVGAHAFYGMGKLSTGMSPSESEFERVHGPRALLLHEVAMRIDPAHTGAASETGMLLARFGRLPEARAALRRSVTNGGDADSWRRLAEVHDRLGESQLADQARQQASRAIELAATNGAVTKAPNGLTVRWVDKSTFEQGGRSQAAAPTPVPKPQPAVTAVKPVVRPSLW